MRMSDKWIRNNQRYNAERKAQAELMKRDLDRDKVLAQIYQESFDRMQREIDGFYMRYANREGLTKQEAMKRVSDLDVTKFNTKAAKAVKEKDFSHATNDWLKVYNLKMKVSRLELLRAELALEIQNLTAEVNEVFDKARTDEYLNEYKRQAGILGISSSGAKKRMQAILDADFYGQNFSARVWGGLGLRATLQREVFGSLNRIFTDMMGYKQEMKRLAKKYGTSEQNAKRLLKTEIARINADTQLAMLKENGFTHVIFVAEPGACDLCRSLDKVAIPIDKLEKGVNMHPMHPNCRCSVYGYIKMEYKAGGSTLDREAPNGVWGEAKQAEAKKSGQRQIAGIDASKQDVKDGLSSLRQGAIDAVRKTNMLDSVGLENYNQFLDRFDIIEDEQLLKIYRKFGSEIEYRKLKGTSDFAIGSRVQLTQSAFDGKRVQESLLYSNNPLSTVFHENGHAFDSLGLKILTKDKRVVIGEEEVKMFGKKTKVSIFAKHASALPEYDLKNAIRKDLWGYVNGDLPLLNDPNYSYKRGEKTKIRTKAIENFANFKTEMLELQKTQPNVVGNISDIVEATGWLGEYPFGDGHGKKYWEDLGSAETEFFAEVSSLVATDIEGYEEVKRIFPNAVATYHRIVDDILGGIE